MIPFATPLPVRPSSAFLLRSASALLLVLALVLLLSGLDSVGTPGWDETGHCFTALRLGVALRGLDAHAFWHEFLRPDYYTPLGRLGMGLGFLFSDGFAAPRAATVAAWILTIALAGILARRVAGPERADSAMLWTVLGGVSSYLGTEYCRCAYQEPWSALGLVLVVLVYLRARDGCGRGAAFAVGLLLGAGLLIKYTYALYGIGAIGLSGLFEIALRPEGTRPLRLAGWCAFGLAVVLAWWFVWPLPGGRELGRLHAEAFLEYLRKAGKLSSVGPLSLLVYGPFKACSGLLIFGLQVAGIVWGWRRWREGGPRLCAILATVSWVGYLAYPFRIDRFLLPCLFGAWVLAGALLARLQGRLPRAWRLPAGGAFLVAAALTAGRGSALLLPLVPDVAPEARPAVQATILGWRNPFRRRSGPATGPPGLERVLEVAADTLDPARPFGWIGGTGTELPRNLIAWALFQRHGDRRSLHLPWRPGDDLWEDPHFDPPAFQAWVRHFPQVGVLDPPDPKARPRPFEVQLAEWMALDPDFELVHEEELRIEVAPGNRQPFRVRIYRLGGG